MKIISKILIVDDEPGSIEALKSFLTPDRYRIIVASNGEKAREVIAHGDVDLVIISAAMPKMSGFDLTAMTKQNEGTSLIPVIMIINENRDEDRARGTQAGCDDFITKPMVYDDVVLRVSTVLELSRNRSLLDEKEKFYSIINNMG